MGVDVMGSDDAVEESLEVNEILRVFLLSFFLLLIFTSGVLHNEVKQAGRSDKRYSNGK